MSVTVRRPPFVMAVTGSSETSGKLSGFPVIWRAQLARELPLQPEAVGDISILDLGHGGWTSTDVLAGAPLIAAQKPNFILVESGDINCSFVTGGVPAVSRAQKISDMQAMVAIWQAAIPGVDICFRTVNPVSTAVAVGRPNYDDYQADTAVQAALLGLGLLDTHTGWPNPLPEWMTFGFDGLHPVWANAVETYAYRKILFLCRQKLAAWWGLPAPTAPTYPTAPDVDGLIIAGGGAGGSLNGGGGSGHGGIRRVRDYLPAFLGAWSIGAGGTAPGGDGTDSIVGTYRAKGGGGGGSYGSSLATTSGHDGGGSGGGGGYGAAHGPGVAQLGQGYPGGFNDPGANNGSGGGGGCTAPGGNGSVDGGSGGPGWQTDVPGDSQAVCGGGPGGSYNGHRPAYPLGGGPTCFGGGGRGGEDHATGSAPDNGGVGVGYIWYPGSPRCTGGVITSSGGFTVHKLTGTGTLT